MGKNQSASGLTNIIQYDNNGNISFVSGSTTLMQISSSGAITTTGVISGSNALSASYALNSGLLNGTGSVGFATTGSLLTVSSSQQQISASQQQLSSSFLILTASYTALSSSYTALSGSYNTFSGSASTRITVDSASLLQVSSSQQQISASLLNVISIFATTGSNSFRATQSITGSLVVSSTITAQTLVVQTVTSSIVYSSGSNIFGCDLNSRQTFTGSVLITGSLTIAGNITGNAVTINSTTYVPLKINSTYGQVGLEFQLNGTGFAGVGSANNFTSDAGICPTDLGFGTNGTATGKIVFATGTAYSTRMVITSAGNVGIGTSIPSSSLHINGSTYFGSRLMLERTAGAIGKYSMGVSTANNQFDITDEAQGNLTRLSITSTGAIGIGTTNPGSFFEAYANCTTNLAYFTTSGSANRMIIGATNLGNGALIDIRAHGSVYTESIFGMCATNTVAVIGAPASGCAMLVGTMANNPLVFGTCNAERLRITNTGAATFACGVSVNGLATSANYKLGATGAAFISGTNSKGVFITDSATYASIVGLNSAISAYNKLELRASGTDGQIMLHTTGNVSIGNPTDTGDQLYLAGNLKMTTNSKIDSNGGYLAINSATGVSVGIGATPANAKLLVYDTGCTVSLGFTCFYNQARGIDLFNANSGTTDNVVGLWISTGPHKAGIASGRTCAETTWEVDLRFYTHPTTIGTLDATCENMRLYGDGSLVTRGATSTPGLYSDINLKENLLRIPSALNKIKCINGYLFDWKYNAPARSTPDLLNIIHDAGLIAQEVEEVMPDIVRNNDLSCIKMLNYNGITALLVEGMKEQQCTINMLKTCLGIA